MIEAFLTKIAFTVFNKAALHVTLSKIFDAIEIYSIIDAVTDCVETINDCDDLRVKGVRVASEIMATQCLEQFINIGSMILEVTKRKSGIYIASPIAPAFKAPKLDFLEIEERHFPKILTADDFDKKNPILWRDRYMPDTIIVRCTWCGEKIGEIAFAPGKQSVRCPHCHELTIVVISKTGDIKIRQPYNRPR
jgi:phage FluMu protein Com